MIVFVDMEHKRLWETNPALGQYFASQTLRTKYRLEKLANDTCLIVHYQRATPEKLRALGAHALIVGGHYTAFRHYDEKDLAGVQAIFREAMPPTLAICGGHQWLAKAYGTTVSPMEKAARSGEAKTKTPLPPEVEKIVLKTGEATPTHERGFLPVRITVTHPLLAGLGRQATFFQLHTWEVDETPKGFSTLATSDVCPVQVIAHQHAPLFGTQFHPEQYSETHPDGRQLLENFLGIAASYRTA